MAVARWNLKQARVTGELACAALQAPNQQRPVGRPAQHRLPQRVEPVQSSAWDLDSPEPSSLYIHLPFCKRKCFYCDFPVVATGAGDSTRHEAYLRQLRREIGVHAVLNHEPLRTVFFGGGTPSLIAPEQLARIVDDVAKRYGIAGDAEVAMEADPGTFDAQRLRGYMAAGVTRFSVGVQAFDEELLRACGRAHDLADVHRAIEALHEAQPPSWSIDLIGGLPGLTRRSWERSVRAAVQSGAPHVSVYDLQVEEGTPFGRWHEQGKLTLPDDSDSASMLAAASARLRAAGYQRYELSNYAQPGHECRHNLAYWRGHGYYAFGLGAASFVRRRRFSRPRQLARYYAYVDAICEAACGHDASRVAQDYIAGESEGEPALSDYDLMLESVMLQLRLHGGINLPRFARAFGQLRLQQLLAGMQPHLQHGRAELLSFQQHGSISGGTQEAVRHVSHVKDAESVMAAEEAVHLALTDPEGLMMSNDIISDAFVTLEEERTAHECDALG